VPYDRYPRKLIRRLVRGKTKPGGVMLVALNLMKGLDRLKIPYRFNNYSYIKSHPHEVACIIGKPHLLDEHEWKNPIVFGAGIFSHPRADVDFLKRRPNIKKILVPGQWMADMFKPFYGDIVTPWPTGIDTDEWAPTVTNVDKPLDFLVYDKIRWERDKYVPGLLQPILNHLDALSLKYTVLRYGAYSPADLKLVLSQSKAAIFLCEHETQGLAYQQILAAGVPILAWDRGGYWQDPSYYPAIKYGPVSSVPYWSSICGVKFVSLKDFDAKLADFVDIDRRNGFDPRNYILENLTLEKCADAYVQIIRSVLN
jgi:hypothetical protein